MKRLNDYFPTLQEKAGRLYIPKAGAISSVVALALIVGLTAWGASYPLRKYNETLERLELFNAQAKQASEDTKKVLQNLSVLMAQQSPAVQEVSANVINTMQAQLVQIQPIDPQSVLNEAQQQALEYKQAQALIKASPYRDLPNAQVPRSPEGLAYLDALEVKEPPRFNYQRLTDGIELALAAYTHALNLQAKAEQTFFAFDSRINGDKAAPLGAAANAAQRISAPAPKRGWGASANALDGGIEAALRQAEREAARAAKQAEAERLKAEREEQQALRQAEREAARAAAPAPTPSRPAPQRPAPRPSNVPSW